MSRDANTAFARALVDEWARAGVTDAVCAPGSRSAPLALALADDGRLRLHVVLDERSAGFFALGLGAASGRPAVVVCTSGTAGANLHPAVLEAHHARIPLLACTADRPPELRDVGAGQTIDQVGLFGRAVRWFAEAEVPADRPDAGAAWRSLAARAAATARGPLPGPVHLDLPFREPLVPTGAPLVDAPGRPHGAPWTRVSPERARVDDAVVSALADQVAAAPRGLLVAGAGAGVMPATAAQFSELTGWPVLADPLSGLRVPGTISTYEALVRAPGFATAHTPDLVLRTGAPLTGKAVGAWLSSVPTILVDPYAAWLDPHRSATERVPAEADWLLTALASRLVTPSRATSLPWTEDWTTAEAVARAALDAAIDGFAPMTEPRIARDLYAAVPDGGALLVASSMPVRDVEWFARPREGLTIHANRGVNGIDGFVSTALGVATERTASGSGPTVALCGDLSFCHDGGGLQAAGRLRTDVVFVVVDNDGGGIFSFLPQAELPEHFETLFATPQGADLAAIARAHGLSVAAVDQPSELGSRLDAALAAGGPHMLHVHTDRAANVAHHQAIWDAVATLA